MRALSHMVIHQNFSWPCPINRCLLVYEVLCVNNALLQYWWLWDKGPGLPNRVAASWLPNFGYDLMGKNMYIKHGVLQKIVQQIQYSKPTQQQHCTLHPKNYTHTIYFVVDATGQFYPYPSGLLQSYDCPSAREVTLMDMGKSFNSIKKQLI